MDVQSFFKVYILSNTNQTAIRTRPRSRGRRATTTPVRPTRLCNNHCLSADA